MWVAVARIILKNRIAWLIGIGLVTIFMIYQGGRIRMGYGFARMMPDDDPISIAYANFSETFGEVSNTIVAVVDDSLFFTPEHLSNWIDLTNDLKAIEGVENVLSVTDVFALHANEEEQKLETDKLLTAVPTTQAEADEFKERLLNLPFYKDLLYTEGGRIQMLLIRVDEAVLYEEPIIRVVDDVLLTNTAFQEKTGMRVHTSGLPYIRIANAVKLKKEVYVLVALTILVTAILLFAFLRSLRATAISLLVVLLGVIFTFGLMGLFQFEISVLSGLIPPLVIIIGVPNCIYLINKYHQEFKAHNNKTLALQRVVRKVGTVTVLTNFTTALGFATFILTDSDALVEFGIVSSTIILLVFLLSILLIPIIYSFLAPPKERHYKHFDVKWIQGMLRFLINVVSNHRPKVYITTIVIIVVGVIGVFQLRVTGSITEDIRHTDPLYEDIKFIEEKFEGVVPLEIVVDTHKKGGARKLSTLKKIDAFQERVSALPNISRSLSLVDFVKFARQGILFGNPAMYALPNRQEQQWMMQYLPHGEADNLGVMKSLLDSTGQKARISMQMADMGTTEMRDLQAQIKGIASEIFEEDNYTILITGASVKFLRTTDYLIKNLILSMVLAIIVISILMAFLFASGRMVLISIIPNIIPLVLTAGIMGYLGIPLKPSTVLVFSIAFGISIDDTLHYLARYRQELKTNGWRIAEAAKHSILETGVSMFYTSVILFFGFGVFLTSSFGGTQAVGLLVSITLFFAMLTNLIILPSLIMTLDKYIRARDINDALLEDESEDEELDAATEASITSKKD
jgi:predicted RND superfamily exporter protein